MAEGERVKGEWPEVTIVRLAEHIRSEVKKSDPDMHGVWLASDPLPWEGPEGYETRRYVPVSLVRERLEAALGLLPCDCPGRGLTDPKQHADECAIGIGGRMIDAALSTPQPADQQEGEHRG